jgi:hypothetical protein
MSRKGRQPQKVEANTEVREETVSFAFNLIDLDSDPDFSPENGSNAKIMVQALKNLRDMCKLTRTALTLTHKSRFDCHPHDDWSRTAKKQGFNNVKTLSPQHLDEKPYQVAVGSKERMHGFFIGNTFYVVWYDPHHKVYPFD